MGVVWGGWGILRVDRTVSRGNVLYDWEEIEGGKFSEPTRKKDKNVILQRTSLRLLVNGTIVVSMLKNHFFF